MASRSVRLQACIHHVWHHLGHIMRKNNGKNVPRTGLLEINRQDIDRLALSGRRCEGGANDKAVGLGQDALLGAVLSGKRRDQEITVAVA